MTNENMTLTKTKNDFIKNAAAQFNEWRDDLERLEDMARSAGDSIEQTYREQIANLKPYLNDIEKQINNIRSTDSDRWEEQRSNYDKAMQRYRMAYGETMIVLKEAPTRPAGWLEGFTDQPPMGSAGWLEGTSTYAEGTEGWVEGMAERVPKSEGWVEGYNTQN